MMYTGIGHLRLVDDCTGPAGKAQLVYTQKGMAYGCNCLPWLSMDVCPRLTELVTWCARDDDDKARSILS